jgi:hypothetical protein
MNLVRRIKDSFVLGIIGGLISSVIFYYIMTAIRVKLIEHFSNENIMRPPVIQLLTMLVNLIVFRILMINLEKEKTGKGFLFVTVLLTLAYFFIYYRMRRS